MKKTVLFLSAVLISYNLSASPVDLETARGLGAKFLGNKMELGETQLSLVYTGRGEDGGNSFYVFEPVGQKGFILIAADDLVYPVLGYSADHSWAVDIPSHIKYFLDDYSRQIDYIVERSNRQDSEVADQWQLLETTGRLTLGSERPTIVSPLLTTTWNQKPYYNRYVPSNMPIGCVATAMAQVMYYWGHPTTGTGSYSYTHNGDTLAADFGATSYRWSQMPSELTAASDSDEVDAVATLMYHCAVSVRMNFQSSGSGAQLISPGGNYPAADWAFVNYFDYKPTLKSYHRDNFTSEQWVNMLKFEIDNTRPVLYAGFGDVEGHAFIFDGYDDNNFFHINWGWGGMSDGYFVVSDLSPGALGVGGGGGNFNHNQQVLAMLEPANSTLPENPFMPNYQVQLKLASELDVSVTSILYNTGFSIQAQIKNLGPDTFTNGTILPVFMDSATGVRFLLPGGLYSVDPGGEVRYTFMTTGDSDLLPGVYWLGLGYSKDMAVGKVNFIEGQNTQYPEFQLIKVLENPVSIIAPDAYSVLLFPNPANTFATVHLRNSPSPSPIEEISVWDLTAQEVKRVSNLETRSYNLSLQGLNPGMYYVSIRLRNQQVIIRKIVVQ